MNRYFLYLIIIVNIYLPVKAQVLQGNITDSQNNPIPYSTVFVKEISLGTASNDDGQFELRLSAGEYTCVFQCMGYRTVVRKVTVQANSAPLTIVLPEMVYSLKEAVVSDGGEDPAYRIMRRVIRKAPLYAGMVRSYNAEVYIRGSLNIRKISAMVKWMARDDLKESKIREGDTFLEESVNEIDFTAPNLTRQKVKSIHSTFPGGNEDKSSGAIGFISGNIYRPEAFGNARSPLAPGAFKYYKFRYEGVNSYGNITVDKIKIIPRGEGPQYVKGTLYIIEGLWCIYSLDITIDEQLGFTIQLKQSFAEVREGAWLPVNNRYKVDMDLLGNAGGFDYNTSIRYNTLVVNPPDFKPKALAEPAVAKLKNTKKENRNQKLDKKAAELMAIENPSTTEAYRLAKVLEQKAALKLKDSLRINHEFVETYKTVFDSNARKADSVYWNRMRPIPLAINELKSVKAFDSIQFSQSDRATDSLKARKPRDKRIFPNLLTGGRYEPDTLQYFESEGLLNPFGISFNSVDGFVYAMGMGYQRKLKNKKTITAGFKPGFAFSRKAFLWDAGLGFKSTGRSGNSIRLNFGSGSYDFNNSGGAASLENSLSSLFFRQNLVRLYRKDYIELKHNIDIGTGLNLKTGLSVREIRMLDNHSDFSFFYNKQREYKANIPENPGYRLQNHRDFLIDIVLSYKPMPYYVIKDGIKVPRPGMNNAPTYSAAWKKAVPFDGFDSDFDLLTFGLKQNFSVGKKAGIKYAFEVGCFLNDKALFFNDFRHFQAQPLVVGIKDFFPVTQMGDYYRYSTDSYFIEGHFSYHSPFLLLKRLPVVRNRMWSEQLLFNYIYVPEYKNCVEFGYGIGNLLYNVGVFAGFEEGVFRTAGMRISLSLFGNREIVIGM